MAVFEKAAALERLNRPFALASIISSRGTPRFSGPKATSSSIMVATI